MLRLQLFRVEGCTRAAIISRPTVKTPHHVKMPFTIGVTPSLVKRVALKGALAHSAHVVLHVHVKEGGVKDRDRKQEEDMVEERKYKGLNSDCGKN